VFQEKEKRLLKLETSSSESTENAENANNNVDNNVDIEKEDEHFELKTIYQGQDDEKETW